MPTYLPTEGYAEPVLILHVPWKNTFNEDKETRDYIDKFRSFLKNPICPVSVRIGYERAKARYQQKKQFVEPIGKKKIFPMNHFILLLMIVFKTLLLWQVHLV